MTDGALGATGPGSTNRMVKRVDAKALHADQTEAVLATLRGRFERHPERQRKPHRPKEHMLRW